MAQTKLCLVILCVLLFTACNKEAEKIAKLDDPDLVVYMGLNDIDNNGFDKPAMPFGEGNFKFKKGLIGDAVTLNYKSRPSHFYFKNSDLNFESGKDFSVQFWLKTAAGNTENVMLAGNKDMKDLSLASQKRAGWSLFLAGGTFGWNMGSGKRRISYMHDGEGQYMLNDGKWHQLTMTYSGLREEVGLFLDGDKKVTYKVNDKTGFDFSSDLPLHIGACALDIEMPEGVLPEIERGAKLLQDLINSFHNLDLRPIENKDLLSLVTNPGAFVDTVIMDLKLDPEKKKAELDLDDLFNKRRELMNNPFTTYQSRRFMIVAPMLNLYSFVDGEVVIDKELAKKYKQKELLTYPEIQIDEFKIWKKEIGAEQVLVAWSEFGDPPAYNMEEKESLVVADWNIWHGGIHHNIEDHGWDSRDRVVEMLKDTKADVIMMQETYSSGDYISAKLGYYYATATDWDYLNQGSNISVISRYPIKEIRVPEDAAFMNVAALVQLSETQDIWVMSNWYGMNKFKEVYDFHKERFDNADNIPVIFAGDFNAVPHTDGGKSLASELLMEAGFTDSYRVKYPDIEQNPGYSHRMGARIDQLYFKGKSLTNTSIKVISDWPGGFPSDHYLLIGEFDLKNH